MAKLKSLLKIEGTLDGLTFYRNQAGEYLVKTKSGVSKSRIENDPAFLRTRENGQEFGHVASSGKLFRRALANLIFDVPDQTKIYRLTKVLSKVKNQDFTSARGSRRVSIGIASQNGKEMLKFFNFNQRATLDAVLKVNFSLDMQAQEISIPSFVPRQNLSLPQGATNVEISAAIMNFDFETGIGELQPSNVINLPIDSASSSISLNFSNLPVAQGESYYFLKIAFFQEINSIQYPLLNGAHNALQIIEIV